MTPDDMDAVVARMEANLRGHDAVFAMRTISSGVCVLHAADLRALLLAYQERGRALEPFARAAVEAERQTGTNETSSPLALCRAARGETAWADYTRARASLKATDTGREG